MQVTDGLGTLFNTVGELFFKLETSVILTSHCTDFQQTCTGKINFCTVHQSESVLAFQLSPEFKLHSNSL